MTLPVPLPCSYLAFFSCHRTLIIWPNEYEVLYRNMMNVGGKKANGLNRLVSGRSLAILSHGPGTGIPSVSPELTLN